MTAHPPVAFDGALRPEWFDRALAVRAETASAEEFRAELREHLRPQIQGRVSLDKTLQQLQRTVGFRSPAPPERLAEALDRLVSEPIESRVLVRLSLLLASVPFLSACGCAVVRMADASGDRFTSAQLCARMQERYGHRATIPRRVMYALQTLAAFGGLKHERPSWARLQALSRAVAAAEDFGGGMRR